MLLVNTESLSDSTRMNSYREAQHTVVSFGDCYDELIEQGGPLARQEFDRWTSRPRYQEVVKFVREFKHKRLFELTPLDVCTALKETDHALGDVPAAHQIKEIEDFTCPFALQHLFHRFIERVGKAPTWQMFSRWMHKQARPYWLDQIEPLKAELSTRYSEERINDAIRWRLGKFYYSSMRELDLLVSLRAKGVFPRYHVLADVLLRVDFWVDRTLVCIYFPNTRFRGQGLGRKPPAAGFFVGSAREFRIVDFEVSRQGFGRTWLIDDPSKEALAKLLTT